MNRSALPPCPKNHMAMAVLSTIFCCLPFGIVAIIKAAQVNSFYMNGFYERAQISANDAQSGLSYQSLQACCRGAVGAG